MAGYDHTTLDSKWQAYWDAQQTFATPTDRTRPKYYVLDMFPYPSGDGLHVGHPKGYTATDVVARAKRMMGCNVLRVMGWDSFGLPAERRAERTGEHRYRGRCDSFPALPIGSATSFRRRQDRSRRARWPNPEGIASLQSLSRRDGALRGTPAVPSLRR